MKLQLNKKIDHRKLWVDSMTGMSLGFFSTLIIATILGIFGIYSKSNIFIDIKNAITVLTPFAIGIGIGMKAGRSQLETFAIALAVTIAARSQVMVTLVNGNFNFGVSKIAINWMNLNSLSSPGDVITAWFAGTLMLYFFSMVKWTATAFDFILLPLLGIVLGMFFMLWLAYVTSIGTRTIEWIIYHTANKNAVYAIIFAPIIGVLMGLALTLPVSSAGMALAIGLNGDAAIAAIAGTSAQMISFGAMTWWSTKSVSKTIAVGFGTSMLHMSNFAKRPILLVIPLIASFFTALISVTIFSTELPFRKGTVTSGMGTSLLYGQIFTLQENGWANKYAWLNVILMQLLLPLLITISLLYLANKKQWIKKDWLQLWNDIQQNTSAKQQK